MLDFLNRAKEAVKAPFVQRVHEFSLADTIQYRRDLVRKHRWVPAGYLMGISFDRSDDAQYATPEVQERWARSETKRQNMLHLIWEQENYPVMGNGGNGHFVFPFGLSTPPTIKDHAINVLVKPGEKVRELSQDIFDYVDGYVSGRDGTKFVVIQPVISCAFVALSRIMAYRGVVDPATGTYPALLYEPVTREAHFVGGILLPQIVRGGSRPQPFAALAQQVAHSPA